MDWMVFYCKNEQSEIPKRAHPEASENVRIALPYIRPSIIDVISKGKEIGTMDTYDDKTTFRPESGPAWIYLRKE